MEPNFIIAPQPDPLVVLWDAFPELLNELDDAEKELGPYYVYGRLVDYLTRQRNNEQLWQRAYAFFDSLASGGPNLEDLLVIEVFEGMCGQPHLMDRLRSNLGASALQAPRRYATFLPSVGFVRPGTSQLFPSWADPQTFVDSSLFRDYGFGLAGIIRY